MGILSRGFRNVKKLFTKPLKAVRNTAAKVENLPVIGTLYSAIAGVVGAVIALVILLVGGFYGYKWVKPKVV